VPSSLIGYLSWEIPAFRAFTQESHFYFAYSLVYKINKNEEEKNESGIAIYAQ
jgi:hypothetical protein